LGSDSDGGYLIPNDLKDIQACFSPGVDKIASFEADLLRFGIPSHLADLSVDEVPQGVQAASFLKKFVGANNSEEFITLESWIKENYEIEKSGDFILQMDIEGAEYQTILSTPDYILNKFRIIVIEIHDIETWAQQHFLNIVEAVVDKLLNNFIVVHNHPNNAMGIVNLNGFNSPRLMEITLIRKDRVARQEGFSELPHILDKANLRDRPDITFPEEWWE
jgi:hypothetical protein